jgi:hypothetical protein
MHCWGGGFESSVDSIFLNGLEGPEFFLNSVVFLVDSFEMERTKRTLRTDKFLLRMNVNYK